MASRAVFQVQNAGPRCSSCGRSASKNGIIAAGRNTGSLARTTSPSVGPGRTKQPTPKRSSMIAWSSERSPAPRTTAPSGTGSPPKRASTAPASSHERAGSTGSTSCRYARRTAGSSRLRRPSRGCARHTPSRDRSRGRGRPWRPSPGDRPPRHEGEWRLHRCSRCRSRRSDDPWRSGRPTH